MVLVSPILSHLSYSYNWRWAVVFAWSGVKGSISLLLAPDVYNLSQGRADEPQKVGTSCPAAGQAGRGAGPVRSGRSPRGRRVLSEGTP